MENEEIYIKVVAQGFVGWWNYDKDERCWYFMDGDDLWQENQHGDFLAGTPFKASVAKKEAKQAVAQASWDGYADAKASLWKFVDDELVKVKIGSDGKAVPLKAASKSRK